MAFPIPVAVLASHVAEYWVTCPKEVFDRVGQSSEPDRALFEVVLPGHPDWLFEEVFMCLESGA